MPLFIFYFLATLHGMWGLSSPTRDPTRASCSGVLTARRPGKSPDAVLRDKAHPSVGWGDFQSCNHQLSGPEARQDTLSRLG